MKFLKAKAMLLSAMISLSFVSAGASYGIEEGFESGVLERTVEDSLTEKSSRAIDWETPEIESSPWADEEIYDARVYGLITYDLAREVTEEISRADAAEAGLRLYEKLSGEKVKGELEDPFSDTDDRNVLKAFKLGIVRGKGGTVFDPDAKITREDLSVIMYNSIWKANPAFSKGIADLEFEDWGDVSGYAEGPMKYMLSNGILKGKSETMLYPKANTTKEETLIIAKRIYEKINDAHENSAKGLFYRVSDGDKEVYILGSIHLGTDGAYPMTKEIREVFKSSDNIAVEVNILEESKLSEEILAKAVYPEGESLKDDISPELYEEIKSLLEQHAVISIEDIEGYRPWYINMVLPLLAGSGELEWEEDIDYDNMTPDELEELENLPYKYTPGIDKYFLEKSEQRGTKIKELEGADYQINMLSDMSKDTQEKLLQITVSQLVSGESDQETLDTMIGYWRAADYDSFESIIESSMEFMPEEYNDALWHIRNREMSDVIEGYLKDSEESHFVVVGAGHLVGETSIAKDLEERGYKVEMIK
jgi:uncharacterized protein